MKTENRPVDIETAVEMIMLGMNSISDGIVINSDFGILAIEFVTSVFDPMDPVYVDYWHSAPNSDWCIRHRNIHADIYLQIGVNDKNSRKWNHLVAVSAIHKAMFLKMKNMEAPRELIDAAVICYNESYHKYHYTMNWLEEEFMKTNMSFLNYSNNTIRAIIRDNFEMRIKLAKQLIDSNRKGKENLLFYHPNLTIYGCEILALING